MFLTLQISEFGRRQSGTVSLIFGIAAVFLFSLIGGAVDYSRWNDARSRTADALDAALLNAARSLQTSQTKEEAIAAAEQSFLENARAQLKVVNPKVTISVAADGTSLEGTATGKIKTPFMGLMHFHALNVTTTSKVGFGIGSGSGQGGSDLEISMMLDVTGSMCNDGSGPCTNGTKMDALKSAASDLVNIVLKGGAGSSAARIALVPFATYVRLGRNNDGPTETLMKKVTNLDATWTGWYNEWSNCSNSSGATSENAGVWSCATHTPAHAVNWRLAPCVTERTGAEAQTDAAPGSNAWIIGMDSTRRQLSWDSADTPIAVGDGKGQTNADPSEQWNYNDGGMCWDGDEKNIVMPLTNDKSALLGRINDLVGYGGTGGTLGTMWTWYTLSANWTNVWKLTEQPGSYSDTVASGSNPPKLRKIAVLMTDGVYNAQRGWLEQDPVQMATDAKAVCANMKAKGIEIYTVGFDLDALPPADKARAIDTLQTCGTDLHHFYEALDAEQLKQSFRDIAMQLAQIYIAR